MRPIDKIFIGYFIAVSFLLALRLPWYPYGKWYLLGHIVAIILFYSFLALSNRTKWKFVFFLRQWYPVLIYTFMYEEVGRINHIIFPYFLDRFFVNIDKFIFGFQPSIEFQKTFPNKFLAEYLYFSYFSYYLLPFVVCVPLYVKKMYRQFSEVIFTISLTFYFCYLFFIIFPVAGPRFFIPEAFGSPINGFFFAKILKFILDNAEIEGGAFPSSHVAIALQLLFFTYKYLPAIRIPMTVLVISLALATVYGRFHYAIDVFGGTLVALIFYWLSPKVRALLGGEKYLR